MGWLWTSNSTPAAAASPAPQDVPPTNPSSQTPPIQPPQPPQPKSQSPDDAELQKLMDFFKAEEAAAAASPSSSSQPPKPSPLPEWLAKMVTPKDNPLYREPDAPRRDPLSESLLPTDMSCRQAFDAAWACNSVGGQWNAVYRYGEMRACSEKWDDFWFCMRHRAASGPVKEELVRAHYRNREHAKYYAPGKANSEDVWEARREKVRPGEAFAESIDLPVVADEEWREMETERRQKIRDGLGFGKTDR
ncbi:hypothetical protein ISF_06203 [Cordyceps fumosorosea ARSEF 2679]|uniref:Early meiotic induction protein 1 n=1 Tax=Cordyceps fumosorosea (strain ARSEF 2679) TaxID=1081104 RepID=A0A167S585_CORFA|nr:hypothetical protein ISF_06203 [Cordyceps fumosorosea ARSEF 2679]OAA59268.1 hypothetical protein ISF_06203 [Cordyceps fumosorosea ARSEF 2679]